MSCLSSSAALSQSDQLTFLDVWNAWDICIVLCGFAFLIARIVALSSGNKDALEISFDILSLEALFLVPRLCSILSVS